MTGAAERLGWTLLHSLWEDALIWLALQAVLAGLRRSSSKVRYFAGCAALGAAVLAPVATYFWLSASQTPALASLPIDSPLPAIAPAAAPSFLAIPSVQRLQIDLAAALPWLVALWAAGCALSAVRLTRNWRAANRLGRLPYQPLGEDLQQRLRSLACQLGIDRLVRLGESAKVTVPSVVGWLKPVILVPAGAFAGLTSNQIDGLLAHELAHILRHDFAVNVLQACCEVLYFYHPAVHAINRVIRDERENACDDLAVAVVGDARGYAAALVELEVARQPALLIAATGHGTLLPRIHRLVGADHQAPSRPASAHRGLLVGSALSLAVVLFVAAVVAPPSSRKLLGGISDAHLPFAIAAILRPTGDFRPGDLISVAEVHGDRPQFEVGGTYLVQGTYTLASASQAILALSLTASSSSGRSQWHDEQFRAVKGGQGTFAFKTTIATPGQLHVSFYLPDSTGDALSRGSSSHGGVYLGTRR